MVIHVNPEGFIFDDSERNGIVFYGSRKRATTAVGFVAYLKTSHGSETRPLYITARIEKLREEPSEFWTEDLIIDILRERRIRIHGLEIHNGRTIITSTLKLEVGVQLQSSVGNVRVKELQRAVLDLLEDIMSEVIYWDRYIPDSPSESEDEPFLTFTETVDMIDVNDENSNEGIFDSLEFWWERFHGEEKP